MRNRRPIVAKALGFPALLLIFLGGSVRPQIPPATQSQEQGSYQISVSVDLVVLNATVRDRKGAFVSNLRQEDFEVYEDGIRQSIRLFRREDVPVTVGWLSITAEACARNLSK